MVTKLLNRLGRKARLSANLKGSWIALRKEVLQELNTVLPLPCFQTWVALLIFSLSCSLMVQDPKLHVSNVRPSIYLMRSQQDQVLMVDNSRENAVLGVGSRSETICFIDLWFLVEVIGWRWYGWNYAACKWLGLSVCDRKSKKQWVTSEKDEMQQ